MERILTQRTQSSQRTAKRVRLGDVCLLVTDGSHNPPQGVSKSEYLMLSSKNVYEDNITLDDPRYLTAEQFAVEDRRTRITEGDVLITIVGTVGRAAVVPKGLPKICLQRSVAVLKPNLMRIAPRYLMYELISMRAIFENQARGVAQKGIYLKQLSGCELSVLPPLSEQKRIAAALDKICEMKRNVESRLQKLDLLIKSRFNEMFGDVGTTCKLSEQTKVITKGTTPTSLGYEFQDKGVTFVKVESFSEDGGLISTKVAHISSECHSALRRSQLCENDILFSIAGAIGRVAVVNKAILPANTNQALAIIRLKSGAQITVAFLVAALKSPSVVRQYLCMKQGVAQLNL